MKNLKLVLVIFILFILYIYISFISEIPSNIVVLEGENINLRKMFFIDYQETTKTSSENSNKSKMEVLLFNKVPLKTINITTIENIEIIPIGKIIGLKLYTEGVLVVGKSQISDKNQNISKPYENSDVEEGDTILKINEEEVENIKSLKKIVNESEGKNLSLTILRNGNIINTSIKPVEINQKEYKIGLWVKDAATGVGTITFYMPSSKCFAALGHGITDVDTDSLINIDSGKLVTSKILSVKKGENENPGEIKGTIINGQEIGEVNKNSQFGVYGKLNNLTSLNIDTSKKYKVALRDEIKEGKASMICSVDESNIPKEYSIEIEKIYEQNDYNNKSMLIKITDEELLKKTGGIIRGLSGAPIIQDGKFIGAITNVLVSNPKIGYAVFADLMIKEAEFVD